MLLIFFSTALILSVFLTYLVKKFALRFKIIDIPCLPRKIHRKPVPLLGGWAVFLAFFIVLLLAYFSPWWPKGHVQLSQLIGFALAGGWLMLGGFLDDKIGLKPRLQLIWPILAALTVIYSGSGIRMINNPLGTGYWHFDQIQIELFQIKGFTFFFTPWADLLTFIWLMVLMYSTKLLDGLDGLVSGVSVIGSLSLAGLCFLTIFIQPDVGWMALILAGTWIGFLLFNFHPAKIFLGESGGLWAGFSLGVLSIISGGKLATAFLILGLAIFDLIGVIIQRALSKQSWFKGDSRHLHFRLLKFGLSHRQTVLLYYLVASLFALTILFWQTKGKMVALLILLFFSIILSLYLTRKSNNKVNHGV